ncbi:MAG: protein-(glutamine-N5) methyltransferase, release factor-specific [Deltaproteobacteria bacterium RIFCSPLOWO2_02_FULL_53_8]|nr:MAG: protein-(glutamine-N5) methyltransferase, release factor-specific [Deltaproteobacteria bacterium RIFCSPLOWO2_02_FULL_53_8]
MTIGQALNETAKRLKLAGIPDAGVEAEYFMTHLLACRRHELFLNGKRLLTASEDSAIEEFIKRRLKREPIQYIIGSVEFHGLEFKVTRDVLIPRPETELLVDEAAKAALSYGQDAVVIDLCTGSGCIAISLAAAAPNTTVYAIDISQAALKVAQENGERLGMADRVKFIHGDLFAPLNAISHPPLENGRGTHAKRRGSGEFEAGAYIIVSNPPYISEEEYNRLQPEIRLFEPSSALVSGHDGLEFYRRIIKDSPDYLSRNGLLMMEAGFGQADRIKAILEADGRYEAFEAVKDLAGIERVVKARIKG